eukprot:GEZU01018326.1.p1 GENE.GEZU01018326.1~~GEZU01018326.1.p1  ORF type:complete len:279 (+),score=83.56 GEZU01018326.1:1047-1883(+)
MGVALNVSTWFYSTPSLEFWDDLTTWVTELSDTEGIPWVHSVSYGSQGESSVSDDYKTRMDAEFMKLGARGVSIIFASGDSGCGCISCSKFHAAYPATSPHVTSVGATQFLNDAVGPEKAVTEFSSGGGFSYFYPRPDYQNASVAQYLSSTPLPDTKYFNQNGRGTPDVSAHGVGFKVVTHGFTQPVAGTSAAAPTFAAIVSLLNDLRLQAGKPTLGFLNYFIYQTAASNPEAFNDITVGSNPDGCCKGFSCAAGWDPVTGVGTPNYAVLAQIVQQLP